MKNTTSRSYLALSISLVLGTANIAFAQDTQTQQQAEQTPNSGAEQEKKESSLEVITVTSEKRVQNLQEVPVAISAFSADMLSAMGISTPQDLENAVPGLTIGKQGNTGGTAKATIRGVGNENFQPGGDPGVPIHINGHYTQASTYVLRDMIDVERVEVQRGPQGTLYGRNAIGGNINIITNRPTDYFEGEMGIELGNYDKRKVHAVVNGPLTDSANGRLVAVMNERDGYVEGVGLVKQDRDTSDYKSVRGALDVSLTDNLEMYVNGYYFNDEGDTYSRRLVGNLDTISNTDPWKTQNNTPVAQTDKSSGMSIDFSWSLDGMEFRSLTAYDDTFKTSVNDSDGSDILKREFRHAHSYETLTQEFQLLSTNNTPLQWVIGAFYYKETSSLQFDVRLPADTNGNGISPPEDESDSRGLYIADHDINAQSWAAFGQLDYSFSDELQLVLGLRYTKDKKDRYGEYDFVFEDGTEGSIFGGAFVAPTYDVLIANNRDGNRWNEITGKLGINYFPADDILLYASFSTGYKAGGYNTDQPDSYDPEYVDAFEAGMKSRWFDDTLQLNLATFYYDYSDKQDFQRFTESGRSVFKILNASSAISKGVELEIQAYLTDSFKVDGSFSYLSAEFEDFTSIDQTFPEEDPDRSGNKLPLSPEFKFNIGAQYEWALSNNGYVTLRADYIWMDDRYSSGFNRDDRDGLIVGTGDLLPSYELINAHLKWEDSNDVWSAELYVRNLADEYAVSNSFFVSVSDIYSFQLAPRTFGVKVNYKF